MKRTSHITLTLLAGMAVAFTTGCHRHNERRDCVDDSSRLAGEQNCANAESLRHNGYVGPLGYHWAYGGSSGGHIGDVVVGGNPMPGMGHAAGGAGGVGRGGFGATAGSGSGGSGGE